MESMSQSKKHSFVEASANTIAGFGISWIMWQFVVAPIFGYATTTHQSFWITVLFTVTSFLRSYVIRRVANWWHLRRVPVATEPVVRLTAAKLRAAKLSLKAYLDDEEDMGDDAGVADYTLFDHQEDDHVHHSKD